MVSGRNHEKEVSHVQISDPQLDPHVLRALNGGAAQVRRPLESPADFVSRHLGHVLPHHQGIVAEALRNELSLFAGAPLVDDTCYRSGLARRLTTSRFLAWWRKPSFSPGW